MAKDTKVKVIADYPYTLETMDLWGVRFEFINGAYVAFIDKQEADAMVKANRVKLA